VHPILLQQGFSAIDRHFADMLSRKASVKETELVELFARLSATLGNQNSCLRVDDADLIARLQSLDCVTTRALQHTAEESNEEPIKTPLVLARQSDHALLYTNRFFQYEARISANLAKRNKLVTSSEQQYAALTPYLDDHDDPQQKIAAIQAVTRYLTIITGGPGTGKTSTVVKILAGLLNANAELEILLAAPTGKAAMRLSESIQQAVARLPESAAKLKTMIPSDVSTLHRLLGVRGDGHTFRYNQRNPLIADVLILDEASMIDLVMFDRILAALPDTATLIILGDPGQLPSVDSGNVLADITRQGNAYSDEFRARAKSLADIQLPGPHSDHRLADAHCQLVTSYRFEDDKGIGLLAKDLNQGRALNLASNNEVTFVANFDMESLMAAMTDLYQNYLQLCQERASAQTLIAAFDQTRLLSPIRDGEFGVNQINELFQNRAFPDSSDYYHGKPVMIMSNHYALRLFNGDIGICVNRSTDHEAHIEVAFKNTDGEIEYYLPSRLPQHTTCFAMTVHKSQGSEFDQVLLVLPETKREDFISRELLYTGITRTRSELKIFYSGGQLACQSQSRFSGLANRFLETEPALDPSRTSGNDQFDLF
jgi:exodeoxyribonuclease V alpha subunit